MKQKVMKNRLIGILMLAVIAALCLCSFAFVKTAGHVVAEDDGFDVVSVKQTYNEVYNGAADGKGQRANYLFTFNKDVLDSAVSVGEDVTETVKASNIMTSVKMNGNTLEAIAAEKAITFYKSADNAIEMQVKLYCDYACFEFDEGFAINGNTLASTKNFYEEQDWTFTETAPAKIKVFAVENVPYSGAGIGAQVNVYFNKVASGADVNKIKLTNGNYTDESFNDEMGASRGGKYFGVEKLYGGRAGGPSGYQFKIFLTTEVFDSDYMEIKFEAGFCGIEEDQTFVLNGTTIANWNNMPQWVEKQDLLKVEEITQTDLQNSTQKYLTEYNIKFAAEGESDLFAKFDNGADVKAALEETGFLGRIKINDYPLTSFAAAGIQLEITKAAPNTIKVVIKYCTIVFARFTFGEGCRLIGDKGIINDFDLYQTASINEGGAFEQLEETPELKVISVYSVPVGANNCAQLIIAFNRPLGNNPDPLQAANLNIVDVITVNGKPLMNGSNKISSPAGEAWCGSTAYNVSGVLADFNNAHNVLKFKAGQYNEQTLAEDQYFISNHNDITAWYNMPVWTELHKKEVTFKQGETVLKTENAVELTLPDITDIPEATEGKVFLGWIDGENKLHKAGETIFPVEENLTFTAAEIDFSIIDGASVRIAENIGNSGIRFSSYYNTEDMTKVQSFITEFGTLIIPKDSLTDTDNYTEFVLGGKFTAGEDVLQIESTVQIPYEGKEGYTRFNGAMINILEKNYDRTFAGRGYLKVTYADGSTTYIYTAVVTRSIKEVAQAALDSGTEFTSEQQAILEAYVK